MESNRGIILLVLVMAAVVILSSLPCSTSGKDEGSIWVEEEPNASRRGPRPGQGPGRGPGPRPAAAPRRFELTDEKIDDIMKGLKERDPAKAKELAKLREKDPEKFKAELRGVMREQFGKRIREDMEARRQKRDAEYVEWLGKNYPKEAEKLAELKEKDAELYITKFQLSMAKYGYIFDAWRQNPELADVLKEDLELRKKRDVLLSKIKAASKDDERGELIEQLEEVVGSRFDLIVRRKQIAYERLLKRLEELNRQVKESRGEIVEWQDDKFKAENARKRTQDLVGGIVEFNWD